MNKNRNKIAAMMMVATITVSSVAVPVEAAVGNISKLNIQKETKVNDEITDVVLNEKNFPDLAFRERLADKFGIENDGTGIIPSGIIESVTSLTFSFGSGNKINSIKGIEKFKNLEKLTCSYQNIKEADLSKNTKLTEINFFDNRTEKLILSNPKLIKLSCYGNNIENLDIKDCENLIRLDVHKNKISNIDLSKNINLNYIDLSLNKISEIKLNNNSKVKLLKLNDNESLGSLDISKNGEINYLDISRTSIKNLDLTLNPKLENLRTEECDIEKYELGKNPLLTALTITSNTKLKKLDLGLNTKLEHIQLKGCNNLDDLNIINCSDLSSVNIEGTNLKSLDLSNAKNLDSLQVKKSNFGYINLNKEASVRDLVELPFPNTHNINIDSNINYIDLSSLFPGIDISRVDVQTEGITKEGNKLILGNKKPSKIVYIYNTGGNNNTIKFAVNLGLKYNSSGELPESEGILLDEVNFPDSEFRKYLMYKLNLDEGDIISKENIKRVREINLKYEIPSNLNKIKSLEGIKYFTYLEKLYCEGNNISKLDLSFNDELKVVDCSRNMIEELILNENLTNIKCYRNHIKEIDLTNSPNLEYLNCSGNENISLKNLNKANNLQYLYCENVGMESIELPQNNKLKELYLSDNKLNMIKNLEKNKELIVLELYNNQLKEINLNENTDLKKLGLSNNQLKEINLKENIGIRELHLNVNKLKKLDLRKLENLDIDNVNISGNEIGKLDFSEYADDDFNYKKVFTQYVEILSDEVKSIDLQKEFGITEEEVNNKVKLKEANGAKLNGTKIEWEGRTPNRIIYTYEPGGRNKNTELEVHLYYPDFENRPPAPEKPEKPENPNPNPNPDQGGSGSGSTNPDTKPEQKPEEKPNGNHSKIIGANRYETAAKIADQIGSYNTVILVNSDKSMADGLSAASLSGKKNAPILLVKKDSIPSETMSRIEKADNIYIIGGEGVISKKVENQLKGKKITRISGKDRYETSQKIANLLGGYKMAFIVNGAKGEADAMSVSSVAAKYGAPILLTNGKTSIHTKKANVNYYVIGGRAVISNDLADRYNADRISGVDRYSTNRKIIDEFYYDSKKIYFAKGDTLVDALTASTLAKNDGIVLVSEKSNHTKLEGKDTVQVGGMNFKINLK